jgi:SH3-like domain-containing protein
LEPGAEVVIVVQTPYWYGIETEDGEHGWINHSQLESLP